MNKTPLSDAPVTILSTMPTRPLGDDLEYFTIVNDGALIHLRLPQPADHAPGDRSQ